MKKQFILILLFLPFSFMLAQTERMDSLTTVLKRVKNDIDKVEILNAIADECKTSDPKMMLQFAQQALQLSKKINYKVAEGNAYLNIGNANIILGSYTIALQNSNSAASLFENQTNANPKHTIEIKKGLAKAYGSMGIIFSEQSNYTKALHFYLKSVKIYESLNDQAKCASIYNNIGIVFKSQSSNFKALEYFIRAQKIKEKINDPNIGITITNIANCYLKQKNFDKAFDYYIQAKKSFDKFPDPRGLGEWYNNFGLLFKETKNTSKAIENWNLAIETFKSIDDKFGVVDTYLHLGQLYLEQHQSVKAIEMAKKALKLSTELGVLEQQMLSEKLLSDSYSKQSNASLALFHYKLYNKAKDSLVNEENTRKSIEAEMNFEFEKKEVIHKKEIENKELLLKEESKRSKLQLFFALLFGVLLFGLGFLIYNRIQLKKTLVLQKELAEYEQKALHLQMNPHFVFNCLGSISSFIVNNGNESAIKYLAKFSKLMRLTLEYSKESLIPIDKEIEGLQNYLELEQLRFNNKFSFSIEKSNAIEDDMAIPPLLLQPFVENAIIHGVIPKKELGTIAIHFFIEKEHLVCTVEDDGIGFQQSQLNKEKTVVIHKSMALDITKKRLQMIESTTNQKADFSIEEIVKENHIKGTKVVLHLPIQYIN